MCIRDSSNVQFKMSFVFLLLCIYLILNILLHALILRVNYKKDIAGSHDGHGLLLASYLSVSYTHLDVYKRQTA